MEDEDFEFPVTIYKGESEYQVPDLEVLEHHLLQGWSLDKPEPVVVPVEPTVLTPDTLDALTAEVAGLRAEVAELRAAIPGADMIKGQGKMIAELLGRLSKLEKAAGTGRDRNKHNAAAEPAETPEAATEPSV